MTHDLAIFWRPPEDVPDELAVPAREAYEAAWTQGWPPTRCWRHALVAVIPLIEAKEREACAMLCDAQGERMDDFAYRFPRSPTSKRAYEDRATDARDIAAAIRARGETQ